MERVESILQQGWHDLPEGREFIGSILRRGRRRIFGLLERPNILEHSSVDIIPYKICVLGTAGVGKTSLVSKLMGKEVPKSHKETPGIQMSVMYWPVKFQINQKVVVFKLVFWDAGEQCLNKFNHVLPACKEDADAVLFAFSFANRTTWEDLEALISRSDVDEKALKLVVGTSADKEDKVQEMIETIRHFEEIWGLPVLKISNTDGPFLPDGKSLDGRAGIKQVAPFLNRLVANLWVHDQVAAGNPVVIKLAQQQQRLTSQVRGVERDTPNQPRRIEREIPPKSKRIEREAPSPAKRLERDLMTSSSSSTPDRQQRKSVSSGRMSVDDEYDERSSNNSSTSSSRKSAIDNLTVTYC